MGLSLSYDTDQASGGFPSSGKPVTIKVHCSHNGQSVSLVEHRGQLVTSDWTMDHLQKALEAVSGVHRQCQQLMFGGRYLQLDRTVQSVLGIVLEAMPNKLTFFMLVDRHRFPQQLGPFSAVQVPLEAWEIMLPEITDEMCRSGFYWEMHSSSLTRRGLHTWTHRIAGQVSPLHQVTLEACQREEVGVPEEACTFAWSYPIADWESLDSDAYLLDQWEEDVDSGIRLMSFLSIGGFMYFDKLNHVVGMTTVGHSQENNIGEFRFTEAKRWEPEWTAALVEQGRFQTITMKSLRDVGARMYLWLRPNEVLEAGDGNPLPRQPDVPHGGFVCLFHDDLFAADVDELVLDRYFALQPSTSPTQKVESTALQTTHVGGVTSTLPKPSVFRSFTLVDHRAPSSVDVCVLTTLQEKEFFRMSVPAETSWDDEESCGRPLATMIGGWHQVDAICRLGR